MEIIQEMKSDLSELNETIYSVTKAIETSCMPQKKQRNINLRRIPDWKSKIEKDIQNNDRWKINIE